MRDIHEPQRCRPLCCNLPWCMHGEHRNAAVDDVHAIFASVATLVPPAASTRLSDYGRTWRCAVRRISAAYSASNVIRPKAYHAPVNLLNARWRPMIGRVCRTKTTRKARVVNQQYITGEQELAMQRRRGKWRLKTSRCQDSVAILPRKRGVHASSANRIVFLVGQDERVRAGTSHSKLRNQEGVGAAAVIDDHS